MSWPARDSKRDAPVRQTFLACGAHMLAHAGFHFLDPRRDAVAHDFVDLDVRSGHPVELNDTARADEELVAVIGAFAAAKCDERSLLRWDLDDDVVDIRRRPQEPQTAARVFPRWVHVDHRADDLAGRIGVDIAVARAAMAANRYQRRPMLERDADFCSNAWAHRRRSGIDRSRENSGPGQRRRRKLAWALIPGNPH